MVLLVLLMCNPVFVTRNYYVLDSGFCVEKVIVQLEARGFYAISIIKSGDTGPILYQGIQFIGIF